MNQIQIVESTSAVPEAVVGLYGRRNAVLFNVGCDKGTLSVCRNNLVMRGANLVEYNCYDVTERTGHSDFLEVPFRNLG